MKTQKMKKTIPESEYKIMKKISKKFSISDKEINDIVEKNKLITEETGAIIEKILINYDKNDKYFSSLAEDYIKMQINKIESINGKNYKIEEMKVSDILPFFHMIVISECYPIVKYLLKKNVNVNQPITLGKALYYPLDQLLYKCQNSNENCQYAINQHFSSKIFEILLSYGAESNITKTNEGFAVFFEEQCAKHQKNIEKEIFRRIYKQVKREKEYYYPQKFYNLYIAKIFDDLDKTANFLKKYNNDSEIKAKAKAYFAKKIKNNIVINPISEDISENMKLANLTPSIAPLDSKKTGKSKFSCLIL